MNDLLEAKSFVATLLFQDPTTALAGAVAWLDPLRIEDLSVPYDEDDGTLFALGVSEEMFPDLYEQAMLAYWGGASARKVEELLLYGINLRADTDFWELHEMHGGIPFYPYGMDWHRDDPGIEEQYPDVAQIYGWLGGQFTQYGYVDSNDTAPSDIASVFVEDLEGLHNEDAERVAIFLRWMFNSTGETMADYTYTYVAECGCWPDWTRGQLEELQELLDTGKEVYERAMAGLEFFMGSRAWKKAFQKNVDVVRDHLIIDKVHRLTRKERIRERPDLNWPRRPANRHSRNAEVAA